MPSSSCRGCWEAAGARVATMAAETHDRVFAAVSHLPHILSFALVSEIAARADAAELLGFAAGGFRDFTRIAASSPEMWRDIALQNRAALLAELDRYGARLAVFRELVEKGDGAGPRAADDRGAHRARTPGARDTAAPSRASNVEYLDLPPARRASGTLRLPGSKSISNRTLLLAALATGTTRAHRGRWIPTTRA